MTRHGLPTAVPCGVCLARIVHWDETDDDLWTARPCGHTLTQINRVGQSMTRARVSPGHLRTQGAPAMPTVDTAAPLTPAARHAYDQYATAMNQIVQFSRALAAAPVDELLMANMRMDTTGVRYNPGTKIMETVDREGLASHRELFELIRTFGTGYLELTGRGRSHTGEQPPAPPLSDGT